jgi:uncharacterized sulfatase
MGWFDGNPTSLGSLAPNEEAENFIRLAGGPEVIMSEIDKARSDDKYQWALQLIDRLIYVDQKSKKLKKIKAKILREHAVSQINCPTRHYYIQCAKELEDAGNI